MVFSTVFASMVYNPFDEKVKDIGTQGNAELNDEIHERAIKSFEREK